jgi:hypothetical protein
VNSVLKAGTKITVEAFEGEIIGPASDFVSQFVPPLPNGGFYKVYDDTGRMHYVWVDRDGRVKAAREPLEFRTGDIWEANGTEWIVYTTANAARPMRITCIDYSSGNVYHSDAVAGEPSFEDFEKLNPSLIRRRGE